MVSIEIVCFNQGKFISQTSTGWWSMENGVRRYYRHEDADQPWKPPYKPKKAVAALFTFLSKQKKVPASNRGTHKKQRARFVQTDGGVAARRAKVKLGMEAVNAAKRSEERTLPPTVPGKRRRRTCCARDVAGWLWRTYRVKFCIKTVSADLRAIKKNSM